MNWNDFYLVCNDEVLNNIISHVCIQNFQYLIVICFPLIEIPSLYAGREVVIRSGCFVVNKHYKMRF